MTIDWQRFAEAVRPHRRFVLTSHLRPDCDALGSELGMAHVLEALGKQVRIVNPQAAPGRLAFIDPERRLSALGADVTPAEAADTDALVVLDTSAWAQLGPLGDVLRATGAAKLVLDHHVSSDDLGAEVFRDATAEATGRLVIDAADALGVALTPEMARPLFAAIATDTGWFRFASVSARTYEAISRLVGAGAVPAEIYRALHEQDSLARVHLTGRTLERVVAADVPGTYYTWVTQGDLTATGAEPADTEDVVNFLLTIAGSEVALILVEQPDGRYKVSFRSRSALDVSRVAERFGGGGHRAAAGAMLPGPLAGAVAAALDALRAAGG